MSHERQDTEARAPRGGGAAARHDVPVPAATIVGVQVGRAEPFAPLEGEDGPPDTRLSAIGKTPVAGRVRVWQLGLAGDEQADREHHGGPDMAVLSYGAARYDLWRAETGVATCGPGWFGENLTIDGLDETAVCLGDRWRCGTALLEVTKPRIPCWKIGRRWRRASLPREVIRTGRPGWYARVIEEGDVAAGDAAELVARPLPAWSVAEVFAILFDRERLAVHLDELLRLEVIGEVGLEYIRHMARRAAEDDAAR